MQEANNFIRRYIQNGYSFFHTGSREKKVLTRWKEFQNRYPTPEEIKRWYSIPYQNYGIVCGKISNLVVFDVDTKNGGDPTPFQNLGLYEVQTPSGGFHFYTLYDEFFEKTGHQYKKGILKGVDVQSNGALVFAPPTQFSQGSYTLLHDTPVTNLPDDLFQKIADAFGKEQEAEEYTPFVPRKDAAEKGRPGDVFNAIASWEDVLIPAGWKKVGQDRSGIQYWRRPGKNEGISASTNWKDYDLFFAYTTSVDGITPKKGYTKFNLYATLNYGGDFSAAAKALVVDNYRRVYNLV